MSNTIVARLKASPPFFRTDAEVAKDEGDTAGILRGGACDLGSGSVVGSADAAGFFAVAAVAAGCARGGVGAVPNKSTCTSGCGSGFGMGRFLRAGLT